MYVCYIYNITDITIYVRLKMKKVLLDKVAGSFRHFIIVNQSCIFIGKAQIVMIRFPGLLHEKIDSVLRCKNGMRGVVDSLEWSIRSILSPLKVIFLGLRTIRWDIAASKNYDLTDLPRDATAHHR